MGFNNTVYILTKEEKDDWDADYYVIGVFWSKETARKVMLEKIENDQNFIDADDDDKEISDMSATSDIDYGECYSYYHIEQRRLGEKCKFDANKTIHIIVDEYRYDSSYYICAVSKSLDYIKRNWKSIVLANDFFQDLEDDEREDAIDERAMYANSNPDGDREFDEEEHIYVLSLNLIV